MKNSLLLILAGALLFGCGFSHEIMASEEDAVHAAESWLTLVDQGKYKESWEEASSLFKRSVTLDQWTNAVKGARESLGKVITRKYAREELHTSLPGVPDGKYVVIFFNTVFEKKKEGVETITPMLDSDGTWRVSGYYVR